MESLADQVAAADLRAPLERGLAFQRRGAAAEAEAAYQEVLRIQPRNFDALHLLGVIALETGRTERGVALIGEAVALRPDNAMAHNNQAHGLHTLGRYEEAVASCDRAIALDPACADAYNNRGNSLHELKRYREAAAACERAAALKPTLANASYNLGNALVALRRYEDAVAAFDRTIALDRDYAKAHGNRGVALGWLRRYDEAIASCARAIAIDPDYAEAALNQSLYHLLLGHFEPGWKLYEARKQLEDQPGANPDYGRPPWRGDAEIAGKTILLACEQGLGDTIQFCRYAKLVRARGAEAILLVQEPLLPLMKQLEPGIHVVGADDRPPAFDFHCALMSLPLAFGTTLETIPAERRYLRADDRKCADWRARLPPRSKPRIGLVWRGSADHTHDEARSIGIATLLPLLRDDAEWICLQKEVTAEDGELLRRDGHVALHGEELTDFSETAALLEQTDLVVTVDTSVAHLAGAMGKPVWILLPFNPDWRWLLDRGDSPWYPSARLFRQRQAGAWGRVVEEVKIALGRLF